MRREVKTIRLRSCGVKARIIITDSFDDLMSSYAGVAGERNYKNNCLHTFCENYLDDLIPDLIGKTPEYRQAVFDELFRSIVLFNPNLKDFIEKASQQDSLPGDVTLVPVTIVGKVTKRQNKKKPAKETKQELKITKETTAGLADHLKSKVFGQDEAVDTIQSSLEAALVGLGDPDKPRGSYIFVGDSGVGKTFTVKEMARYFSGDDWRDFLYIINGSEFGEEHETAKLLGSPQGYVGYEDGSPFLDRIKENPESIVLVDEFEKAHPKLQDVFLQILDDGSLVSNKGERVDFSRCFVVFTSNVGTREVYHKNPVGFTTVKRSYEDAKMSVNSALKKACRPEFLKRFDGIIVFQQLQDAEMLSIARAELNTVLWRLNEKKIKLVYDDTVVSWLVGRLEEADTARDMNAIVKNYVTLPISKYLMKEDDYNAFKLSVRNDTLTVKGVKVNGRKPSSKVTGGPDAECSEGGSDTTASPAEEEKEGNTSS